MVRGRSFTEHDDAKAANVAIANQTMVEHRWPTVDPIGKRISFDVKWAHLLAEKHFICRVRVAAAL